MLKITPRWLMILITVLAAAVRFYNINQMSLMNDELSAIMRTHYTTFHDLIYKGIATEGHPAGVQLFLFGWVHLFGDEVWVLRLPFVITGILCVPLVYLIGEKWFNANTGLFAALSLALLKFPVLYSQLARMYSPGMFFVLLFAYCLTRLFFMPDKRISESKLNFIRICFVLSGAGCMYTHYFAFLAFVLLLIVGFVFCLRDIELLKMYVLFSSITLLTFAPHINLFFLQLKLGGVGEWLAPPDENTFRNFISLLFNGSNLLWYLFFGTCATSFVLRRKEVELNIFHVISLSLFLITFLVAFYYSIFRNPLLQITTMLFTFPFLLLFIFSFLPEKISVKSLSTLLVFAIVLFSNTFVFGKYYTTQHFGEFKQLAQWTKDFDTKLGTKNITHVSNTPNGDYLNYYFSKYKNPVDFKLTLINNDSTLNQLKALLSLSSTEYFLFAWSNMYTPPHAEELIREVYPFTYFKKELFNSGLVLLSKKPVENQQMKLVFEEKNDFENSTDEIVGLMDSTKFYSGKFSIFLNDKEFSPGIKTNISPVEAHDETYLTASVWINSDLDSLDAVLVLSLDKSGKSLLWKGAEANKIYEKGKWKQLIVTTSLPQNLDGTEQLSVYLWNRKKQAIWIDDLHLRVEKPQN